MRDNLLDERAAAPLPTKVSVLVLGGGPAGVAAAISLAEGGVSVLLIERTTYEAERVGESFPPTVARALAGLGVWGRFDKTKHLPSYGIRSYWGADEPHERSFIFDAYGTGWHVDRRAFDYSLARAAAQRNVPVLQATRLLSCDPDEAGDWTVRLATGSGATVVSAQFMIDATGRRASLVHRLGGARVAHNQLVGVYGYYGLGSGATAIDNFMLIEAVEDGWWYSVPQPESRLAITFMTDADLAAHRIMRDVSQWYEQLRRAPHTSARVTDCTLTGQLKLVSANNSRSEPLYGHGWLAVGDAAIAYDPLSGDGVLRALDTGKRGATAARAALAGDESQLREYSRELLAEFDLYLRRQAAFYGRGQRWSAAPFWSRRH